MIKVKVRLDYLQNLQWSCESRGLLQERNSYRIAEQHIPRNYITQMVVPLLMGGVAKSCNVVQNQLFKMLVAVFLTRFFKTNL